MRDLKLRTKNLYTKIPKTNHDTRYGHIHYTALAAIVEIIRDHGGHVNWSEVSEKTGISRFTLGEHFELDPRSELRIAIDGMLDNVDTWLEKQTQFVSRKSSEYNKFVLQALFGIMDQGCEFFSAVCEDKRHEGIIYRVAERLFQHLNFDWLPHGLPIPDIESSRGRMCIRMLEEVILDWGQKTGCNKKQTEPYIARIQRIIRLAEDNKLP